MLRNIPSMLRRLARLLRPPRRSGSVADCRSSTACPTGPNQAGVRDYQLELDPTRPIAIGRHGTETDTDVLPLAFGTDGRMAVPLECGDFILTPELLLESETTLELSVHVDSRTTGSVEIHCIHEGDPESQDVALATICLDALEGEVNANVSLRGLLSDSITVRLSRLQGGSGPLHLQALRVSTPDRSRRVNALSSYVFRMRNEISNFSGDAYRHQMYGDQPIIEEQFNLARSTPIGSSEEAEQFRHSMRARVDERLSKLYPAEGEVSFNFALRALGILLPHQPPNFFLRASKLRERGPLKVLSILSGAARVEEQLLAYCGAGVEITLIDASPDLIERAAARFKASHPDAAVACLVGDINEGLPGSGCFDIILCVSALHHVANLELVLSQVNARLAEHGEFWSIGEQIGRNGNRLWPDALRAANNAFAQLPDRLRKNAHTGLLDVVVSDRDFSIGCFEGIRSEELETLLEAHFLPEHVYKRNAFLWRLVDATYGDNFVLSNDEDVRHLKDLVAAEAMHWVSGGRSTELHGVYRKKFIAS